MLSTGNSIFTDVSYLDNISALQFSLVVLNFSSLSYRARINDHLTKCPAAMGLISVFESNISLIAWFSVVRIK